LLTPSLYYLLFFQKKPDERKKGETPIRLVEYQGGIDGKKNIYKYLARKPLSL